MKLADRQIKDGEQRSFPRANLAAYGCVLGALVCVLIMGFWGLYHDLTLNRSTILQGAVSRLRAQAARRAAHLETAVAKIEQGANLSELRNDPWLEHYWAGVTPLQDHQLYAAVVDTGGKIVLHSDPSLVGRQLRRNWYDRIIDEVGEDVVESTKNLLSSGQPSFDIRIPLMANGRQMGDYHEGLSKTWVDERIAISRRLILRRWSIVIGAILIVILLSVVSLYFMARRAIGWRQAVALAHTQRITEVGQLAAGLAHEIRNPLHAIRLNLHTLRRAFNGNGQLDREDVDKVTQESQEEIDRIDQLMRELLGYASPETARDEVINVSEEIRAALEFLSSELQQAGIEVKLTLPNQPAMARIDKTRFRQVMLNIVLNAKEVMPDGGVVRLALRQGPSFTEIIVEDEGPGVSPQDRDRVFEPFYTTKTGGMGFGLAIAKRFVTDAGGSIVCLPNGQTGATFRLTLPRATKHETSGVRT